MTDVIAEFVASLTFDVDLDALKDAEDKTKEAAERGAAAWQQVGDAVKKIGQVAAGAATGLFALVEQSAASAAEIDDLAQRANIGTRELQRLSFAAAQAGAGPEQLADAFKTLDRQITEARKGTGPAAEAFRALGLSATALVGLNTEQRFGLIADALQRIDDPARQTKITLDLLGGSADKLRPMLAGGAEGLRQAGDEAERLGLVLSEDAIAAAAAFDDQIGATKAQLLAMGREIGLSLLPVVQTAIREWRDWGQVVIGFGGALAGLKLAGFAQQLTSLGFAAAGAKLGVAGLVLTVGSLSYTLAKAADEAFGLSDALAGVNQQTGGRKASALGELSDSERASLDAAVAARDTAQRQLDEGGLALRLSPVGDALRADAERAQAEIDSINAAGRGRRGAREKLAASRAGVDAFAKRNAEEVAGNIRTLGELGQSTRRGAEDYRKSHARKGGGGKAKFSADLTAGMFEFDDAHGDEIRGLADRFGVGEAGVDAALKAGAEAVAAGSTTFVARNAALSRLSGAAGVDLTIKRQTDPLLSQIFGDENVPDVQLSQIARGTDPQVLISNITNHFDFKIEQTIDGAGDPSDVADLSGRAIRDYFQGAIASATNTAKVNFAR